MGLFSPGPESRTATSTLRESAFSVFITNSRAPSLAAHIASTALMISGGRDMTTGVDGCR
jgi:hypothetical protein